MAFRPRYLVARHPLAPALLLLVGWHGMPLEQARLISSAVTAFKYFEILHWTTVHFDFCYLKIQI